MERELEISNKRKILKPITNRIISSISYLLTKTHESRETILFPYIQSYIVNEDFMCEFYPYITKDMFNKAALSLDVINKYPELFDEKAFVENIKTDNKMAVPLETLIKYFPIDSSEAKEIYRRNIGYSDSGIITPEIYVYLYGQVSPEIDEYLTMIVSDDAKEVAHLLLLQGGADFDKTIPMVPESHIASVFDGSNGLSPEYLFKALYFAKNIGTKLELLNHLEEKKFSLSLYSGSGTEYFAYLMENCEMNVLSILLKYVVYFPNCASHRQLQTFLHRQPDEDELIPLVSIFKQAGLKFDLKKYAEDMEYDTLLQLL